MNKSVENDNKRIMIINSMLGIVLIATIVISVVFFHGRLKETKQLLDSSEYDIYDNYYVMVTGNPDSDYWVSIYDGALEEAKKSNSYVKLMGDDLEDKFSKEDVLRMAINSSVDGIIVEGDDNRKCKRLLREAEKAGIPVVTVAEDSIDSGRKSFIGVSGYNIGKDYGEQVCRYVRDYHVKHCDVMVLLDNSQTTISQSIILTTIKETINNYNMDEIIEVESKAITSNTDFAAEEEIRDIFVDQVNLPDVIVCLSEKSTACVYQTVVDFYQVGKVEIFGYYLSPTIETAINNNVIKSSLVVDTKQMGQYSVRALNEYKDSSYVSEIYLIDTSLVTKESLQTSDVEGGDEDDQEAE